MSCGNNGNLAHHPITIVGRQFLKVLAVSLQIVPKSLADCMATLSNLLNDNAVPIHWISLGTSM